MLHNAQTELYTEYILDQGKIAISKYIKILDFSLYEIAYKILN